LSRPSVDCFRSVGASVVSSWAGTVND
jgi:hypothetical protein